MFRIVAFLGASTLGDFCNQAVLASSMRGLFDKAELFVVYRRNKPFKEPICENIWNADKVIPVDDPDFLALDYFNLSGGRPKFNFNLSGKDYDPHTQFNGIELFKADLLVSGSMLHDSMFGTVPQTVLCPPLGTIERGREALLSLGVDPYKWIATVYWKEGDYGTGYNKFRTIFNPEPYIAVIRHIIEEQGGQVIRLGHQASEKLPKLPELIDLAAVKNAEWLQLYAVTASRFYIGSGSGPSQYPPAFNVPSTISDLVEYSGGRRPHDYCLTQEYVRDGKRYRQLDALDAGFLDPAFFTELKWERIKDVQVIHNTADDLIHAANAMYNSTLACVEWRPPPELPVLPNPRPNGITFPIRPFPVCRELLIPPGPLRAQARSSMPREAV